MIRLAFVARAVLLVLCVFVLAACGGEKTVSPTGEVVGTLPKAAKGNATAGKKVFADNGCASCHTFKAAGATGTVGPDLDKVSQGKDAEFVRTSITDPNAEVAPGYPKGVMPTTYGSQLSSKDLADLVAFLTQK